MCMTLSASTSVQYTYAAATAMPTGALADPVDGLAVGGNPPWLVAEIGRKGEGGSSILRHLHHLAVAGGEVDVLLVDSNPHGVPVLSDRELHRGASRDRHAHDGPVPGGILVVRPVNVGLVHGELVRIGARGEHGGRSTILVDLHDRSFGSRGPVDACGVDCDSVRRAGLRQHDGAAGAVLFGTRANGCPVAPVNPHVVDSNRPVAPNSD